MSTYARTPKSAPGAGEARSRRPARPPPGRTSARRARRSPTPSAPSARNAITSTTSSVLPWTPRSPAAAARDDADRASPADAGWGRARRRVRQRPCGDVAAPDERRRRVVVEEAAAGERPRDGAQQRRSCRAPRRPPPARGERPTARASSRRGTSRASEPRRAGRTLDRPCRRPSLYRRHRPRTFADVVGQEHVVRTLCNASSRAGPPRVPVRRLPRHRQDVHGEDPGGFAELRAAAADASQPCGDVRVVRVDRQRDVARRRRDGRGVQQLRRRHPRPARARRLRAGLRPLQGLHPRRGAHAHAAGVERVPQDARGAAAAHDLRARHDRGQQGPADGRRPLPPLRLRPPDGRADRRACCAASPTSE